MGETQFMKAARDKIEVELGRHTEPVALSNAVWKYALHRAQAAAAAARAESGAP